MLAHQALDIGGKLAGQIQDTSQVAIMLNSSDDAPQTGGEVMTLQNLGFKCVNKELFAQPMVQAHFLTLWYEGDRALANCQQEEVDPTLGRSCCHRIDMSWMRTPRMRFIISTTLYVIFLALQAITATQVANVQPKLAEAGAIATAYVFAWGHFFEEWGQWYEFKVAGDTSAYWGDTGNIIDMMRVHLFVFSFVCRGVALILDVAVTSGIFRAANISYSFFIVLCWVHFLSRTVGMNQKLGTLYIVVLSLLHDVIRFVFLIIVFVLAFAFSISKLFLDGSQSDPVSYESGQMVGNWRVAANTLFWGLFGMSDW